MNSEKAHCLCKLPFQSSGQLNTLKTMGFSYLPMQWGLVLLCNKENAAREKNMAPLSGGNIRKIVKGIKT